jgi:hypothetical protein
MTWLNLSEAQQKGIDVALQTPSQENMQTKVTPPVRSPAPRPAQKTATVSTGGMTLEYLVGRWGLAAYHKDPQLPLAMVAARGQCQQPYTIAAGPSGGVMMHLADESRPRELTLKAGRYIGPAGAAGGQFDRELVDFDGQFMIWRWINPETQSRYGTMVFARCKP